MSNMDIFIEIILNSLQTKLFKKYFKAVYKVIIHKYIPEVWHLMSLAENKEN